jgi:hypothetical protein
MAEQELNGAPSRSYIRAYLAIWAVLGVLALGYLTTLAWQPDQLSPGRTKGEPETGLVAKTKALAAEVGTVRETVDSLQKDVSDIKDSIGQRGDQDKALQSRVSALEEKLATIPATVASANGPATATATSTTTTAAANNLPGASTVLPGAGMVLPGTTIVTTTGPALTTTGPAIPAAKPKVAEKAQPKTALVKPAQPKTTAAARTIEVPAEVAGTASGGGAKSRLETGSIAQADVAFGEAVVTKAGQIYAVQLDVAPSVDVLRLRWSLLLERYGSTLSPLEPRFVAPRTPGAPYRLVAGPVASAADARLICGQLRAQSPACSTTDFAGDPL